MLMAVGRRKRLMLMAVEFKCYGVIFYLFECWCLVLWVHSLGSMSSEGGFIGLPNLYGGR